MKAVDETSLTVPDSLCGYKYNQTLVKSTTRFSRGTSLVKYRICTEMYVLCTWEVVFFMKKAMCFAITQQPNVRWSLSIVPLSSTDQGLSNGILDCHMTPIFRKVIPQKLKNHSKFRWFHQSFDHNSARNGPFHKPSTPIESPWSPLSIPCVVLYHSHTSWRDIALQKLKNH